MWQAFKALSIGAKLGIAFGIVALFAAIIGSTAYVSYNKGLNVSKVEIAKYEGKIQKLNSELKTAQGKVDVRVVTEYKDRVSYVDRVVYQTRDVIRDNVPEQFTLSKGWVYAYNQSIAGLPVDPVLAADKTPSSISEMRALADTIAPNNGVYLANKAQLDSLQKWIKDTEAARAQVTK